MISLPVAAAVLVVSTIAAVAHWRILRDSPEERRIRNLKALDNGRKPR